MVAPNEEKEKEKKKQEKVVISTTAYRCHSAIHLESHVLFWESHSSV